MSLLPWLLKMKIVNYNHNPTARLDSIQESFHCRQAEKKIRIMEELQSDLPDPKTVRRVVYDLRVHQVESEIQNEDIEKLFDPFYTSKFFGRGLGLSIVLGIVRAHSGFLMVTSKVGRGSLFSIFLPVCGRGILPAGDRVFEEHVITGENTV